MRKTLAAILAVSALAVAGAASAQAVTDTQATGTIVSVTTDSFVVRMYDGTQRTFATDSTTTMPSARLAEGNRVTVKYRTLDAGRWQATTVSIAGPGAAPIASDRMPDQAGAPLASDRTPDRAPVAQDPLMRDTTPNRDNTTAPVRALPDTASNMPLLALAGGAALAGALALTVLRRAA